MIKKCKICGKEFDVDAENSAHRLYCDRCRIKRCVVCGKEFLIKPKSCRVRKFCSHECYSQWLKGRKQLPESVEKRISQVRGRKTGQYIKCLECGKVVYKYPRDLKHKQHFCSQKCHYNFIQENASPKRNNKGKEKEWAMAIYRKDNWMCQICGYKGKGIEAHHLMSWKHYPKLRFELSNGMTLCDFCHKTYTDYGKH